MKSMKEMPYKSGIKVRIYPSNLQKKIITVNFGVAEFVYNRKVAWETERYELKKVSIYLEPVARRIEYLDSVLASRKAFTNAIPFLNEPEVDSLAIDNALKNYSAAWKHWRDVPGAGVPTFHRRSYSRSYQTNPHYDKDAMSMNESNVKFLDKSHVQLPKLGRIRIAGSKKAIQWMLDNQNGLRLGTITISIDSCGDYYASFQLGDENPFICPSLKNAGPVGIDLNLENFLTDSDGNTVENPRFRRREEERLASLQRIMSRKAEQAKKDGRKLTECKNYQKIRVKVAKLHKRVSNRRDDFQHVVSANLVKSHDEVYAEDLKVTNMVGNHKLAKSIEDAAWSSFIDKVKYKAERHGTHFEVVSAKNTTQTCSVCGHVLSGETKLTLKDREWVCPYCGTKHNRDENAAKNILARGLATSGK